ncbi:hypothetical protein AAA081_05365 [Aedoeadaptatus acetigenes]|uniref:Uncharacterized protein n=1 Tax=Aedoeadaptatus acetigenes TaxID=2981723 RepID=A0ABV1J6A6_9FIRM
MAKGIDNMTRRILTWRRVFDWMNGCMGKMHEWEWIKNEIDDKIDMNIGAAQEYDEAICFIEKR